MQQNFYQYQQRCLSLLLGWSFLSMITGSRLGRDRRPACRVWSKERESEGESVYHWET